MTTQTLSLHEIESYKGQGSGKSAGSYLRYYCPIHGSNHQRSLSLSKDTGWFHCFSCGAKGFIEEKKVEYVAKLKGQKPPNLNNVYRIDKKPEPKWSHAVLQTIFNEYPICEDQAQFGNRYMQTRGISFYVARKYGVGYLPPKVSLNNPSIPPSELGRLLFPHHNEKDKLVNIYSRAVGNANQEKQKHHHLIGPKGIFNAQALNSDFVVICEGVFDALSCLSVGIPAVAIFGVSMDWNFVKSSKVLLALDNDQTGQKATDEFANLGVMTAKDIYILSPSFFEGCKDLNEVLLKCGPHALLSKLKKEIT